MLDAPKELLLLYAPRDVSGKSGQKTGSLKFPIRGIFFIKNLETKEVKVLDEWRRIRKFLTSPGIDAIVVPKRASRRSDRLALVLGRNGGQSLDHRSLTLHIAVPEKTLQAQTLRTTLLRNACKLLGINIIKT